jgi:hypothetical protein
MRTKFLRHDNAPNRKVQAYRSQHIQDTRDVVNQGKIHGFDGGPIRKSTVSYQERVRVADTTEQGIYLRVEDSGADHTYASLAIDADGSDLTGRMSAKE